MSEGPNPTPGQSRLNQRFGRLVAHARWSLWWEEAWPRLWLPLAIVLAFLTLSWLGLWLDLPVLWRTIGLGLHFTASGHRYAAHARTVLRALGVTGCAEERRSQQQRRDTGGDGRGA